MKKLFLLNGFLFVFIPLVLYFIFFCILTYPSIMQFWSHLYADKGDGLQFLWNLWWVNKSIMVLHQSPWFTHYLYFPYGTSLVGHSLSFSNGLMAIILQKILPLIQTYNVLVILSFILSGLFVFLLCHYVTRSYTASLIGGYIFSFSPYHFAHAQGHFDLISMQWLPLFILIFLLFLDQPTVKKSLEATLVLSLILFTNIYYFVYTIITLSVLFTLSILHRQNTWVFLKSHRIPFLSFIFGLGILCAVIGIPFLVQYLSDPLSGGHLAQKYSVDLFSIVIPGEFWRFREVTSWYWSKLGRTSSEGGTYVGIVPLVLSLFVVSKRRSIKFFLLPWYVLLVFFLSMSFGPVLHVSTRQIVLPTMPYRLLEIVFPPIKLSGVPERMIVMVMLFLSVLSSIGLKYVLRGSFYHRAIGIILCLFLLVEFLPKPMITTTLSIPPYIQTLKDTPSRSAVIDTVSTINEAMYYQTIHDKPIAFGYISRTPKSVAAKNTILRTVIENKEYDRLCQEYGINFLITTDQTVAQTSRLSTAILSTDGTVSLYQLDTQGRCAFFEQGQLKM